MILKHSFGKGGRNAGPAEVVAYKMPSEAVANTVKETIEVRMPGTNVAWDKAGDLYLTDPPFQVKQWLRQLKCLQKAPQG